MQYSSVRTTGMLSEGRLHTASADLTAAVKPAQGKLTRCMHGGCAPARASICNGISWLPM